MKKIITITSALMIWAGAAIPALSQDKKAKQTSDIQEVTFVTTIDCNNCKKKVEAKIPYEKGVKDLKVTLDDRTVWIKFNASRTNRERLAEAIRKLGYEAEELSSDGQ